jgi:FkbM family methyltransferase
MDCDSALEYPSPVVKLQQQWPDGNRVVWIPQNEVFRVRNIFDNHDYSVPPQYLPTGPLTVVDIGANVGLFALYMKRVRADCEIFCFEPVPPTLELLKKNIGNDSGFHICPYALSNREETAQLHLHPLNSGENSLKADADTSVRTIRVPVKDAATVLRQIGLSYIDILKIDTEGCEVEILESLQPYLPYVGIVMVEFHSEKDRRSIDQRLETHLLFDANICNPRLGIVKYINTRLV